jgi:septal ring factor EnvC (AmiA/AmiB activator)
VKPPFDLSGAIGAVTSDFSDDARKTERIRNTIASLEKEINALPHKITNLEEQRLKVYNRILEIEERIRTLCPSE